MNIVPFALQIIALIAFFMAWFRWPFPKSNPWDLVAMGLFFWLLSLMISGHVDLHPTSGVH